MSTTHSQRKRSIRRLVMAGAAAVLLGGAFVTATYANAEEASPAAEQTADPGEPDPGSEDEGQDEGEGEDDSGLGEEEPGSAQAEEGERAEEQGEPGEVEEQRRNAAGAIKPFPSNAKFDYQIQTPYKPRAGVTVVSRDHKAPPAGLGYDICYVNAFQSQPDEDSGAGSSRFGRRGQGQRKAAPVEGTTAWFVANPAAEKLLLKNPTPKTPTRVGDPYGKTYYVDPGWEKEVMFDLRNPANYPALADIVGRQIQTCADSGYDAVEFDNLDTFTRALSREADRKKVSRNPDADTSAMPKLMTDQQALDYASLLIERTHDLGMAAAQKNTAELGTAGQERGFDFAVVENCGEFGDECLEYESVWKGRWVDIEYTRAGFSAASAAVKNQISVVLRDEAVSAPGTRGYQYDER